MSYIGEDPNHPYGNYELPEWFSSYFDERQRKQIMWSMFYDQNLFRHGTDGHNSMLIISKLAELCMSLRGQQETASRSYQEERTKVAIIERALTEGGWVTYNVTDDDTVEVFWINSSGTGTLVARIKDSSESGYLASVFESMNKWDRAFKIVFPNCTERIMLWQRNSK